MSLSGNIIQINKPTVKEISLSIATKIKTRRLELNLSQEGLSVRSGVNIETYRRFERTGQISLTNLIKIAEVMNLSSDFDTLFSQRQFQSIEDILNTQVKTKKRGSRK